MNRPDTAAIRARLGRATQAPWVVEGETRQTVRPRRDVQPHTMTGSTFSRREDAAFVANARQDIPDLLTWIDELEPQITAAQHHAAAAVEELQAVMALLDRSIGAASHSGWVRLYDDLREVQLGVAKAQKALGVTDAAR